MQETPAHPSQPRKIIHVDMDAFYASVEQRDNPALRGRPVIVGGAAEKRGVVAAASYEVREFGVHSAMPTSRALRLCPHAILVKPRHSYYREVSLQIREIFKRYTDLIEPLSLDEAFLDVTVNKREIPYATQVAREIKEAVREEIRLTASAGVAPNKFLAKIASDMNKPDGLTVVKPHMVSRFLRDLPVNKIWGVGRVTAEKMQKMGIRTIGQLAQIPEAELSRQFGKLGAHFHLLARGEDDRPVQPYSRRKSISSETTFARDTTDRAYLESVVTELAGEVADTMTRKEMKGSTVTLKLRYGDFTTITRSRTLPFPTDSARVMSEEGFRLLDATRAGQEPVRLIGIGVSNLVELSEMRQLMLFDPHTTIAL